MKRLAKVVAGVAMIWVLVGAAFLAVTLLQHHDGMPGPLLPGQERPDVP